MCSGCHGEAPAGEAAGGGRRPVPVGRLSRDSGSTRWRCSQTTSRNCLRFWTRAWPRPSIRLSSPSSLKPAVPPESRDSYLSEGPIPCPKESKSPTPNGAISSRPSNTTSCARKGPSALHRQVLEHQDAGHLPLRRLRSGAVQRGREVRLEERLAQFHPAHRRRAGRGARGPQPRHGADRSDLRPLWLAPGSRLPRRPRSTGLRYCINSVSLELEPKKP